jgi:hypothetical protein
MSDQENARRGGTDDPGRGGAEAPEERFRSSQREKGRGFGMEAWWEDRSLPQKILLGIGFGVAGVGLLALCGWVVMLLWNALMPEIFGLKTLSYWQAWGLLILSSILFKGMRFGSDSSGRRTDRKRRQHLRRYVREDQKPAAEA